MNKYETLPFISISAENLDLADEMLSREEKGELLEMIISYIRKGEEIESDKRHINATFNQFKAVIERKSKSYFGRKQHIDEVNAERRQPTTNLPKEDKTSETEDKPTFDDCVQTLKIINTDRGKDMMVAEANKMYQKYKYPVKDLYYSTVGG